MRGRKPVYLNASRVSVRVETALLDIVSLLATPTEIFHLGVAALLEGRAGELPVYMIDRLLLMKKAELEKSKEDLMMMELVYTDLLKKQVKTQVVSEAAMEEDP